MQNSSGEYTQPPTPPPQPTHPPAAKLHRLKERLKLLEKKREAGEAAVQCNGSFSLHIREGPIYSLGFKAAELIGRVWGQKKAALL